MTKLSLPFLILLHLYPITFKILPFLNTRKFMAVLGGIFLLVKIINSIYNRKLLIKKELIYIFLSLVTIAILSVISALYNNTQQLQYVSYVISNIVIFTSAYFIIKFINSKNIIVSNSYIIKLIVYSIAIQCLISITMHFVPPLKEIVYFITAVDDNSLGRIETLSSERVIGFGLTFFWAGAYCGMGLIFIAYLIRYSYIQTKYLTWFVILYAFIFLIGMMMARTTLIGATLSVLLLILPKENTPKRISLKSIQFISLLLTLPILFVALIYIVFPNLISQINYLIEFAFELFINLNNSGELETGSTNILLEMFRLPTNLKTWIIGDGYWTDPISTGYYMSTDVGFLRLIYYFGLIGLLSLTYSQFLILKYSLNKKLIVFTIFLYFLILNIKGFFEFTPFFALLIASHYQSKTSYRNNHKRSESIERF